MSRKSENIQKARFWRAAIREAARSGVSIREFWMSYGDPNSDSMAATYQWDNRGRMTQMAGPFETLNYQYDAMSRLVGMTDGNSNTVATAQYDQNSLLSQLSWGGSQGYTETRQYNALQQLTRMTTTSLGTGVMDMEYVYTAGANNGRIAQSIDHVANDTVAYSYDSLNRLVGATSSLGNNESMSYDGFGNLTSLNGVSYTADGATNQRTWASDTGYLSYDASGNLIQAGNTGYEWDVEGRLKTNGALYDPWGKRVRVTLNSVDQWTMYSITGQSFGRGAANRYFGGKLIQSNGVAVVTDRLGSVRVSGGERMTYTAYGAERGSGTSNGREKFGTYFRDGTGMDYADQRYYGDSGAFMSPDPGGIKTAHKRNPASWNRYAYADDDPVNNVDPTGLACIAENGIWVDDGGGCESAGQKVVDDPGYSITMTVVGTNCQPGETWVKDTDTTGHCENPEAIYGSNGGNGSAILSEAGGNLQGFEEFLAVFAAASAIPGLYSGLNTLVAPEVLYHFTSAEAAASIAESGTILPSQGLFGYGVYGTAFNSATVATLMGANSTEVVVAFSSGLGVSSGGWPGAYVITTVVTISGQGLISLVK